MCRCGGNECGEAVYLHGDHLGSVSLATYHTGNLVSQTRYTPYGQVRWSGETVMPTKFSFTGHQSDGSLSANLYQVFSLVSAIHPLTQHLCHAWENPLSEGVFLAHPFARTL
jgi:hypothetical protein